MEQRKLAKHDCHKIQASFKAQNKANTAFDEAEILAGLPPALSMTVMRYLYKDFLQAIPLFKNLSLETTSSTHPTSFVAGNNIS